MPPKVRLDLMVNQSTKGFLQKYAADNNITMSAAVDALIVEHLMDKAHEFEAAQELSKATLDCLRIESLKQYFAKAVAAGRVMPFEEYCRKMAEGRYEEAEGAFTYIPGDFAGYAVIVGMSVVDELHDDIITTYGGDDHLCELKTVDVYLEWCDYGSDDEDPDDSEYKENLIPGMLCFAPKGAAPVVEDACDWEPAVSWPKGIPAPGPTEGIDASLLR